MKTRSRHVPGLRVGQCYPVLEILASPEAYCLRILDDDADDPGTLWDPDMFETVDGHLPASWSSALAKPVRSAATSRT